MSLVQDLARVLRFGCCYDIVVDFEIFIYLMNVEKFFGYSSLKTILLGVLPRFADVKPSLST